MEKKNNKKKNYGISLLRIILSFMVVIDHFYDNKKAKKYVNILYYHIPTFFVISFYYTNKTLVSFDRNKIKFRFKRLVFPYFCWTFISFCLNNIYFYLCKRICPHKVYDLLNGLLNGMVFIVSLWFQNILIFTTLLLTIFIWLFKNDYLLIFQIFMILSYIIQYSGENYKFFKNHFNNFYAANYGRFIDTFPNSLTGFFIASMKINNKIKYCKLRTIFICIFFLLIVTNYNFDSSLKSFRYGGLRLNIASCCIFFVFFFSFEKVKNLLIIKIIDILSIYSAGIYFIHIIIGKGYIIKLLLVNKINTIFGCFNIYIISYMFCFLIDKIFGNTNLKHLIK